MTETTIFSVIAAVVAGIATLGALAGARIRNYRRAQRSAPGVLVDTQEDRHRPMIRLMADSDAAFVRQYLKCPHLAGEWERARRRVIRLYLQELAGDFTVLHRQARGLVARSPEQYASLVPILFRQQILFWRMLLGIELRLTFHATGLGRVNAGRLLEPVEAVRREIARVSALSPA